MILSRNIIQIFVIFTHQASGMMKCGVFVDYEVLEFKERIKQSFLNM